MRVALTGGIATGKSHCLRAFAALGLETVDADLLARQVVEPGTAGLAAVAARFGSAVLHADGTLDREALGRLVFADTTARQDLEAIVHPLVYQRIDTLLGTGLSIADIPLLFETGHEGDFARVIVAACRPDQQIERLLARHLDEASARLRIQAQLPIAEKVRRADYVIDTSGSLADTDRQVIEVYERLTAERQLSSGT